MKIGITGANGFIGNHLVRSAIGRGHRPVLFLQRGSSMRPLKDISDAYEEVWGDLNEPHSLDRFLGQCDHVFHLAGYNRYWSKDPDVFRRVNIDGAIAMAEGCLRHGIRKLVHVSSCITLGASEKPVARDENAEFNLRGIRFAYAETKKAGEEAVLERARKKGLPAVVVNPASAIGDLDYGPTPIGKPIADICQGRWPVYVSGGACFIDVRDVIDGLWLALEKGRIGERYLLAGENLSNEDFMCRVAEAAGVRRPRMKIPVPVIRGIARGTEWMANRITRQEPVLTVGMSRLVGRYLYFDGRKAREELGFEPGPTGPAIDRCVRWMKDTRAWS